MLCLYSVIYCTMLLCCFVVSNILHFVSFMFGMQIDLFHDMVFTSWLFGLNKSNERLLTENGNKTKHDRSVDNHYPTYMF